MMLSYCATIAQELRLETLENKGNLRVRQKKKNSQVSNWKRSQRRLVRSLGLRMEFREGSLDSLEVASG